MSCGGKKACCGGECACNRKDSLNSIVELEIHYSETEEKEASACIFESLYCITNLQNRELTHTGLEGNSYDDMDSMRLQIIGHLISTGVGACGLLKNADISYIKDDVQGEPL